MLKWIWRDVVWVDYGFFRTSEVAGKEVIEPIG
ncbi:hypothetical protein SESI111939_17340 [Serratia silvae]